MTARVVRRIGYWTFCSGCGWSDEFQYKREAKEAALTHNLNYHAAAQGTDARVRRIAAIPPAPPAPPAEPVEAQRCPTCGHALHTLNDCAGSKETGPCDCDDIEERATIAPMDMREWMNAPLGRPVVEVEDEGVRPLGWQALLDELPKARERQRLDAPSADEVRRRPFGVVYGERGWNAREAALARWAVTPRRILLPREQNQRPPSARPRRGTSNRALSRGSFADLLEKLESQSHDH